MDKENNIIIYQDENEVTRVSVRFADEDLWLTQAFLPAYDELRDINVF